MEADGGVPGEGLLGLHGFDSGEGLLRLGNGNVVGSSKEHRDAMLAGEGGVDLHFAHFNAV